MTMNILAVADALSSQDLLDQLHVLAGKGHDRASIHPSRDGWE